MAQLREQISQKDDEIAKIPQTMKHQAKELDLISKRCVNSLKMFQLHIHFQPGSPAKRSDQSEG